jgi:ADP-heptose:LPS heptosyltransferase
VYHDLVGDRLRLMSKGSPLRTQAKNAAQNQHAFVVSVPTMDRRLQITYTPEAVRRCGSVLTAMLECAGLRPDQDDFRLPVPLEWQQKADALLASWKADKPLLIYRPLVERTEWSGCAARNPDAAAYTALIESIRDRYFVLSIADLVPGKEWISAGDIAADVKCHAGELDFQTLAGLTRRAAIVFCSPGFMAPLSQAVGAPLVTVFGGYENGTSFSAGAKFAPHLPIEPVSPCSCFSHHHDCQKTIDVPLAIAKLQRFADAQSQFDQPAAA